MKKPNIKKINELKTGDYFKLSPYSPIYIKSEMSGDGFFWCKMKGGADHDEIMVLDSTDVIPVQ